VPQTKPASTSGAQTTVSTTTLTCGNFDQKRRAKAELPGFANTWLSRFSGPSQPIAYGEFWRIRPKAALWLLSRRVSSLGSSGNCSRAVKLGFATSGLPLERPPRVRVMLVLAQVSSIKTRRDGSIRPGIFSSGGGAGRRRDGPGFFLKPIYCRLRKRHSVSQMGTRSSRPSEMRTTCRRALFSIRFPSTRGNSRVRKDDRRRALNDAASQARFASHPKNIGRASRASLRAGSKARQAAAAARASL